MVVNVIQCDIVSGVWVGPNQMLTANNVVVTSTLRFHFRFNVPVSYVSNTYLLLTSLFIYLCMFLSSTLIVVSHNPLYLYVVIYLYVPCIELLKSYTDSIFGKNRIIKTPHFWFNQRHTYCFDFTTIMHFVIAG